MLNHPLIPNMPNLDLEKVMQHLLETGKRTHQLWLNDESLGFVARGREYRSEFHLNPSYEVQYSLKGDLYLHYRDENGKEQVAHVPEGSCLYQPAMVPHSPRFAPDAFQLVIERARKPGEIDRFHWYCPACDKLQHVEEYTVDDYTNDPVGQAYANFYDSEENRTCKSCGTVTPVPEGWELKV
ncbi:MAG: 3-hydroxybutyryl-CoA dehydratase [Pigmentiphaga sp.]|nr:3-hydroxybutyryl-CoA dehydratase [Pigmentiphaga sp.]